MAHRAGKLMDIPDYPNITALAVPFFIGSMLLEVGVARIWGTARYETRDTLASLLMGAGNLVVGIVFGFVTYGALLWTWEHLAPVHLGFSFAAFAACFVLDDLRYYWVHRCGHEVRWLWASHVNHHSSQHYNLSTALRQTWTSIPAGWFLFRVPLALLGFHPALIGLAGGVNLVYQFWIHTEAIDRCPRWFEAIMNTPSHHRVHHATNPRYLDSNYAGVFIVWDRMFGTFVPEQADDPPHYGLVKNLGTFNPVRIAFHEWMSIARDAVRAGVPLSARLRYLFGRPGYSHDGTRRTSQDIKRDYLEAHPDRAGTPGFSHRSV